MCGIAGIVQSDTHEVDLSACFAMTKAMSHRGPDDEGVEKISADPAVCFGHRRLAVIDLSVAGHQPMQDPETGNWITFNGEIYNFADLRSDIKNRGQCFHTATDTEVILKAYSVWGRDCVKLLRGIFAFGIWDADRRSLLLARDQLGVKPLYIWRREGVLIFSSEVRAILATGMVARRLDPKGLHSYLAYGSVQEPFSLICGVRSLPPGSFLLYANGRKRIEKFWQIPEAVNGGIPIDIEEQTACRLADAVGSQLVSDAPLGAFLSGGIDSTAIAALMSRAATTPVRTFSLVFRESRYDERRWSQLASRHIGAEHTQIELSGESVRSRLSAALNAFDQPSVDGLNTYFISGAVRTAGLTVALSGVGGDELFGGYDGYRKALLAERFHTAARSIPGMARRGISHLLASHARSEPLRKAAELLTTVRFPYFITRRLFSEHQVRQLVTPEFTAPGSWEEEAFGEIETVTAGFDPINRASALELRTFMLSTLLRDTDQMSMANSLEVRAPLIDPRLVEFCFTLPGFCKLAGRHPKPLLTSSLAGLLPAECVNRSKKGFELPFEVWLRDALQPEMRSLFHEAGFCLPCPFQLHALRSIWKQFQNRLLNWSRIWALFVLRFWLQLHRVCL